MASTTTETVEDVPAAEEPAAPRTIPVGGVQGVRLRNIVMDVIKGGSYLEGGLSESYSIVHGIELGVTRDTEGAGGKSTVDVTSGDAGVSMRMVFNGDVLHNLEGPAVIYCTTPRYVPAEWHVRGRQMPRAKPDIRPDADCWVIVNGEVARTYEPVARVAAAAAAALEQAKEQKKAALEAAAARARAEAEEEPAEEAEEVVEPAVEAEPEAEAVEKPAVVGDADAQANPGKEPPADAAESAKEGKNEAAA